MLSRLFSVVAGLIYAAAGRAQAGEAEGVCEVQGAAREAEEDRRHVSHVQGVVQHGSFLLQVREAPAVERAQCRALSLAWSNFK